MSFLEKSSYCPLFKNVFLKLRFTARKARICLRTFYWSSARLLGKRGSRVRPTQCLCPESTRGKNPCFFPLAAPLFPSANRRSSLPPKVGPAAGRRTNARPKRLNGLFYLPGIILGCSTGQIRRLGGRKTRQKRIFHQTREFYLLLFRRPCTEFDLT